jgi:hypothetical protein
MRAVQALLLYEPPDAARIPPLATAPTLRN